MFNNWSQRQSREEAQCSNDDDYADQPGNEQGCVSWQASRHWSALFSSVPANQQWQAQGLPARTSKEHDQPEGDIIEKGVGAQPGEGTAIVVAGRGKSIQNLAKTMRARVKTDRFGCRNDTAIAVPTFTSNGGIKTIKAAIFISKASIFFPRYSGVRPTISPATNTATMTKANMPYNRSPLRRR